MSTQDNEHVVTLQIKARVVDGLYIPIDEPLTDEEREGFVTPSLAAASEVCQFLQDQLVSLGVDIEHISVLDCYTVPTTKYIF